MADQERILEQAVGQIYTAEYVLQEYNTRRTNEYYTTWKNQIERDELLYRGEIAKVFAEEQFATKIGPLLMNLPETFSDDLARLVCESTASVKCRPRGQSKQAKETAAVESAVGHTYWEAGDGDEITPFQVGDMAVAGTAFLGMKLLPGSEYPIPFRFDPRGCYPTWDGPNLIDLIVVEEINGKQAQARFGDRFTAQWDEGTYGMERVKVLEWYRPDVTLCCAIAENKRNTGKQAYFMRDPAPTELGCLEVVGVRRATADNRMRGMFTSSNAKIMIAARIISQILDANDYALYSQPVQRDTNYEEVRDKPWLPITLQSDSASFVNQPPRELNPQSFQLLQWFIGQIRSEIGYPEARQGDISQSIGSASFVGSVMGQLTTNVRSVARDLGSLRKRWTNLAYKVDKLKLDREKPLYRSVGKKVVYTPSEDFSDRPSCEIIFGAGAGLDKLQALQMMFQALGYRVMSRRTVMEQMDGIGDVGAEQQQIDLEQWQDAQIKYAIQDPAFTSDDFMTITNLMANGMEQSDAIAKVKEAVAARQAQMQQQQMPPEQPGETTEPPGEVPDAEAEQQAISRGGEPGNAPALNGQQGYLPPMNDVLANPQ